jgi:hypothetical protein
MHMTDRRRTSHHDHPGLENLIWTGLEALEQRLLLSGQTLTPLSSLQTITLGMSAGDDATAEIDSRIAGQSPSQALDLFSPTTSQLAWGWNGSSWTTGLDLTDVSAWNNSIAGYSGNKGGTLISARQILFSKHYPFGVGDEIRFDTSSGTTVARTVVAVNPVPNTDLSVGLLDSDVPAGITPASVLPADYASYFPLDGSEIPVDRLNAAKQSGVWETTLIEGQGASSAGTFDAFTFTHPSADLTPDRAAFSTTVVNGDSGSPIFIILDNKPVLISLVTSGTDAAFCGPVISDYIDQINQVMAAQAAANGLDPSGYQLSVMDLGGLGYENAFNASHTPETVVVITPPGPATLVSHYLSGQKIVLNTTNLDTSQLTASDFNFWMYETSTSSWSFVPSVSVTDEGNGQVVIGSYYSLPTDVSWLQLSVNGTISGFTSPLTIPYLPGDINGDGLVDVADYDIWAANVGQTGYGQGDANGDGLVDVADYDIWAANVGRTASSYTTPSVPSAPSGLSASAQSDGSVYLNWNWLSSNQAGFRVYASSTSSSSQFAPVATITYPNQTSCYVSNLNAGTQYWFEVKAINFAGESSPSNIPSVTTILPPPSTLTATAASSSEIDLNWSAVTGATLYGVYYYSYTTWNWNLLGTTANTSCPDTGLTEGQSRDYYVVAENALGSSQPSYDAYATSLPSAPTNIHATGTSGHQANITWTNHSNCEYGFTIQESSTGTGGWTTIGTVYGNTQPFVAPGPFDHGSTYYFRVGAYEYDSSNASYAAAEVGSFTASNYPATPSGLTSTAIAETTINLQWTASTGATSYRIEQQLGTSGAWTTSGTSAGNSFQATGLTGGGTTYSFRVVAINTAGESGYSSTYTTATQNQAPTVATAASAGTNPVTTTSTTLTVLGADDGGESNLTYTWSSPNGGWFSDNYSNTAKSTTINFYAPDSYPITVTIADTNGLTVTSNVTVTVNQTLTTIWVEPGSVSLQAYQQQLFIATAVDQFGTVFTAPPAFTWSLADPTLGTLVFGLFTAGGTAGGTSVIASANGVSGEASVVVGSPMFIDFNDLTDGTVVTNQYPQATFSCDPGLSNQVMEDGSRSHVLGTFPVDADPQRFDHNLYVNFTLPVDDLSFQAGWFDSPAGQTVGNIKVYANGTLSGTANIISSGNGTVNTVDLSSYQNVTRIEICNITDPYGLAYTDFSFRQVGIDLQIDSDNNNGLGDPDGSNAEEVIQDAPAKPGKILFADNGDSDGDGIPDYADGFNLDGLSDTPTHQADDQSSGLKFAHIAIEIPGSIDTSKAQLQFNYSASDPSTGITVTGPDADKVYTLTGSGSLRIWTKDGDVARDKRTIENGGDFIDDNGWFDASKLTWTTEANGKKKAILYIEGVGASISAGDEEIKVSLNPANGNNVTTDAARVTVASITVEHQNTMGVWTDTGRVLPMYQPTPLIVLPDLTDANVAGTVDTYAITANQGKAYDPLSFLYKVQVSIDGQAWADVTTANQPAPTTPGTAFESDFGYTLTGLQALRNSALGTERRYVFKATDYAGRTAYEELILQVVFDPTATTTNSHKLKVINGGAPANSTPPTIPQEQELRLRIGPDLGAATDQVVTFSLETGPMYVTNASGQTVALVGLKSSDFTAGVSKTFVVVNDANEEPGSDQLASFSHFYCSFPAGPPTDTIDAKYDPAPSTYGGAEGTFSAKAAYLSLSSPLSDDNTKNTDPIAVRYVSDAVNTGNFQTYKLVMTPIKLTSNPNSPIGTTVDGQVELIWSANGANELWYTQDNVTWTQLTTTTLTLDASKFTGANATMQLLICGEANNSSPSLGVIYTRHSELMEVDQIAFHVETLTGLAGEALTSAPYLNYVHTFNATPATLGQIISVGLDPYAWSQITGHFTLPASGQTTGTFYLVPHKSPAQWAANPSLSNAVASVTCTFSGNSIAQDVVHFPAAVVAGDYDVVLDLVNANGDNTPDDILEPGDIIGKFTTNAADAEVHVVADPLTAATNPITNHAAYAIGWAEYGTTTPAAGSAEQFTIPGGTDGLPVGSDLSGMYIHGEVYYPSIAGGVNSDPATGSFPLVVILHGRHDASGHNNYLGYVYLQQRLAQMGYVSISVDLDQYVAWDTAFGTSGILVRAWCGAMNIDYVLNHWTSPVRTHIDATNLTLIGHSRGGEAVVELAHYVDTTGGPFAGRVADPSHGITAIAAIPTFTVSRVISVSPTANQTTSPGNRPYLVIYGSADGDLYEGQGLKLYDADTAGMKALLFVDGANHNYFNTNWTVDDTTGYHGSPIAGGANRVSNTYQQNLLTSYTLDWIWGGTYLEYFTRPADRIRPPSLIAAPLNSIQNEFNNPAGAVVLDDFESNPSSALSSSGGTVTQGGLVSFAGTDTSLNDPANGLFDATNGAVLQWDRTHGTDYYRQGTVAATQNVSSCQYLSFRMGLTADQTASANATIELQDSSGHVCYVSTAALVPLAIPYQIAWAGVGNETKMAFQTYRLDLQALQESGNVLDLTHITEVSFIFDQTDTGKVAVDDIEFTN